MTQSAVLALALRKMDGVGRVTTRKLLRSFDSYGAIADCPFEQVLHRIKGVGNAQSIVQRLHQSEMMHPLLDEAESTLNGLAEKGVHVLTMRNGNWPGGIKDLPGKYQPDLLYAYGPLDALTRKRVAFFGADSIESEPFEAAQSLIRPLHDNEIVPVGGCTTGFDVVIHKRASSFRAQGSVMVAHAGLTNIPKQFRSVASASVRSGGVMISPFAMDHGPFDHDDGERAYLQAALADACLFFAAPDGSPERRALEWAVSTDRRVYGWGDLAEIADDTHPIELKHISTTLIHYLTT